MAFIFRLEREDGSPAVPPTLTTAVPNWRRGDTIPLSRERALRVLEVRERVAASEDPVLVVEPVEGWQASGLRA